MKILIKTPVVLFLLFYTVVEFGQNLGNEISDIRSSRISSDFRTQHLTRLMNNLMGHSHVEG